MECSLSLSQQQAHKLISCPISPPPYVPVLIYLPHSSFAFLHSWNNLTFPASCKKFLHFCFEAKEYITVYDRLKSKRAQTAVSHTSFKSLVHSPFWCRALGGCRWCRWRWWEPWPCWRGRSSGCPPCLWPARSVCTETLSANDKKLYKAQPTCVEYSDVPKCIQLLRLINN